MAPSRILIVKLSSMGDVIHTLPAAATLKHSFPDSRVTWVVRPQWAVLLRDNPYVDEVIALPRSVQASLSCARRLRAQRFDLAVDFQGLIQTALFGVAVRPKNFVGFHRKYAREGLATLFYSNTVETPATHVVDRNLQLASGAGASNLLRTFSLPDGTPENAVEDSDEGSDKDALPEGRFILACPFAGWGSKQWPLESWAELTTLLAMPLVVNGPPGTERQLSDILGATAHVSGIAGLIHATRRAFAVIGVDSGPMHLAAALGKPGVAIFGPTDPARNGPYGGSLRVLRDASAVTDYRRDPVPASSMRAITPKMVAEALEASTHAAEGCSS